MKDTDIKKNHIITTHIDHEQWMRFREIADATGLAFAAAKRLVFITGLKTISIADINKRKIEFEQKRLALEREYGMIAGDTPMRELSPEARKKISDAQKRRWAKAKLA